MFMKIWEKISKKEISLIYLLFGSETFIMNETKNRIIQAVLNEEEKDLNYSVYDLEEVPIEQGLEDAETLPFLGERRVIVLNNPSFLTADKSKQSIEHNLEKLQAYIQEPSPFTTVIFVAPYEKLDDRKKITKLLKKQTEVLDANKVTETEIRAWIQEKTRVNDVEVETSAVEKLMQLTGGRLMLIAKEMEKLILYVGKGGIITEEMVKLLVPRTLEQNIFELIDAIVNRHLENGLRIFYDLLQQNEEPIKIVALLANQFRLIYQVKDLSLQGYGQQQMAKMIKVHPFRVKLAVTQSKRFHEQELLYIMNELAEADFQMKTGKMDKRLLLELFFVKLRQK